MIVTARLLINPADTGSADNEFLRRSVTGAINAETTSPGTAGRPPGNPPLARAASVTACVTPTCTFADTAPAAAATGEASATVPVCTIAFAGAITCAAAAVTPEPGAVGGCAVVGAKPASLATDARVSDARGFEAFTVADNTDCLLFCITGRFAERSEVFAVSAPEAAGCNPGLVEPATATSLAPAVSAVCDFGLLAVTDDAGCSRFCADERPAETLCRLAEPPAPAPEAEPPALDAEPPAPLVSWGSADATPVPNPVMTAAPTPRVKATVLTRPTCRAAAIEAWAFLISASLIRLAPLPPVRRR